jgi:hypothetical protein
MSQNNNTWLPNEEISNYIFNAHPGSFTSLITAPDVFQVKKNILFIYKLHHEIHRKMQMKLS